MTRRRRRLTAHLWSWVSAVTLGLVVSCSNDSPSPSPVMPSVTSSPTSSPETTVMAQGTADDVVVDDELREVFDELEQLEADLDDLELLEDLVGDEG